MKKIDETVKPRTLLVKNLETEFKITIPPGSRVTFGPTIPFKAEKGGINQFNPGGGYSLRVYANSKNDSLIAVFGGIVEFRDISIPHAKLVIRESGKSLWRSDEDGYQVEESVQRDQEWKPSLLTEKVK